MKKLGLYLFLTILLQSLAASADLWTVTQQWSPEMETKYQEWVKTTAKVDMFSREFLDAKKTIKNPYFGMTTDCADTVYALRVLFSFENGLPWAIKNPANPKSIIAQSMKRFDNHPEGVPRLRAFFNMLFDIVSTTSLQHDTYPVSLSKIGPGVIILTAKINHHSWTIAGIDAKGNPRLVYNSVVGKASGSQLQQRSSWPNPFWVFQPDEKLTDPKNLLSPKIKVPVYVPDSYAGFRYWIPVDKLQTDARQLPEYSNDQYELDLKSWKQTIQNKLATKKETLQEVVERLLKDACDDVKQRITAIDEVDHYRQLLKQAQAKEPLLVAAKASMMPIDEQSQDLLDILKDYNTEKATLAHPQCLTAKQYDQLSTPSRDRRLFDAVMLARAYFVHALDVGGTKAFSALRLKQFKRIFAHPEKPARVESDLATTALPTGELSICRVKIGKETLDMAEIKRRLFKSWLSSNPNEDVLGRWGGHEGKPSELGTVCSTYGEVYNLYDLDQAEVEAQNEIQTFKGMN